MAEDINKQQKQLNDGLRLSMSASGARSSSSASTTRKSASVRSREYEGFFPQHPARANSEMSMSVVIPDKPLPLRSAPAATAHKYDRRRDYFADSSTLEAAMGKSASLNAGIRYDIRDRSSVETTTISLRSALRSESPSVYHIDKDDSTGKAGKRGGSLPHTPSSGKNRSGKTKRGGSGLPLFWRSKREETGWGTPHGDYGQNSQLPQFMVDQMHHRSHSNATGKDTDSISSSLSSSSAMQNMLELEEAKLLDAERKSQQQAADGILTEEQKIAYVGLVYLLLIRIQDRLNVQYKESQSSTASYMNFSRRLMSKLYAHIQLSAEEQRMIEMLPRHKISVADMAHSLAAQGDTILVEADQDLAVVHDTTEEDLFNALRNSEECRSSSESTRESSFIWKKHKRNKKGKPKDDDDDGNAADDIYEKYSALPTEGLEEVDEDIEPPESLLEHNSDVEEDTAETILTKVEAEKPLTIDVRATLILDLFLILLADDVYDSRGRYLLRCLADAVGYPWYEVMRCERRVGQQLRLSEYASDVNLMAKDTATTVAKERAHKGRKRRLVIIGLATVGGGLVIGLSAGLLAPAIGAGIGATLGAIGVANTGAFFGSIGGTALITGAATLTGSGLAGSQITRRTRFAEQFEFVPCVSEQQTNLILTVPGWLEKADNGVYSFSTLDPINGDHCSLLWETEALRRLGSSLRMIVGEVFSITLTQTLQHTVLPSLLGPLSIPMWLAKLGYVLDNPWSNGCELAQNAGPVVADLLLKRVQGQRPVTLVGYSIGARLIFYALLELAAMNAFGLVEDVYLFGAPVVASEEEWRMCASVVGGRFVNGYSSKDWILGFFYRTTNLGRKSVAGMHPITGVNGLENVDVSADVPGHNAYREVMPLLLHDLGVPVTSTELFDPNENPGQSEEDRAMINELERAAELLEEHDKRKKSMWARCLPFLSTGNDSPTSPSTPKSAESEDKGQSSKDVDEVARELAELGVEFKEVPSTLPALVLSPDSSMSLDKSIDSGNDLAAS